MTEQHTAEIDAQKNRHILPPMAIRAEKDKQPNAGSCQRQRHERIGGHTALEKDLCARNGNSAIRYKTDQSGQCLSPPRFIEDQMAETLLSDEMEYNLNDARDDQNEKDDIILSVHDSIETVIHAAETLGYDLNAEDQQKVWKCFCQTVEKKEQITLRELDAIIAAEAMQVPPAYHDIRYVINTGNQIGAMGHMKLKFHDQEIEGISSGDGAIDAAFNSIEQATGRHFELDDFQIRSVTEGREAMGETVVRLRWEGKLYSGRGISTDIVGAGIMAYLNAVNKIVYEEEEA